MNVFDMEHKTMTADFEVYIERLGRTIIIPKGFVFDGSTIPRPLQTLFGTPFDEINFISGLVHDYLYDAKCPISVDRQTADEIFYEMQVRNGRNKYKAWIMKMGIRIGGSKHFKAENKIFPATSPPAFVSRVVHT